MPDLKGLVPALLFVGFLVGAFAARVIALLT